MGLFKGLGRMGLAAILIFNGALMVGDYYSHDHKGSLMQSEKWINSHIGHGCDWMSTNSHSIYTANGILYILAGTHLLAGSSLGMIFAFVANSFDALTVDNPLWATKGQLEYQVLLLLFHALMMFGTFSIMEGTCCCSKTTNARKTKKSKKQ